MRRAICTLSTAAVAMASLIAASASAATGSPASPGDGSAAAEIKQAVAEAATRSGLPTDWIWTVIAAESGGDPQAVSAAGARGLMQIMPATWGELRARLGLGADPFDVHDNVLAGAAYLRQLIDRFGMPGALAAYNAGPGRYLAAAADPRRLPAETRAYVARLARRLTRDRREDSVFAAPAQPPFQPQAAGLFAISRQEASRP